MPPFIGWALNRRGRLLNIEEITWALIRGGRLKNAGRLIGSLRYMEKSNFHERKLHGLRLLRSCVKYECFLMEKRRCIS